MAVVLSLAKWAGRCGGGSRVRELLSSSTTHSRCELTNHSRRSRRRKGEVFGSVVSGLWGRAFIEFTILAAGTIFLASSLTTAKRRRAEARPGIDRSCS